MATGVDWLQKQRKVDLAEIASDVGLRSFQKMNKEELTVVLEEHLRANWASLSRKPEIAPFFHNADVTSPVKLKSTKTGASEGTDDEKKPRRRQTIKAKEEFERYILKLEDVEMANGSLIPSSLAQSPAARKALDVAANIRLPPSPAVLANQIDAQTTQMRESLSSSMSNSRWPRYVQCARSTLSSAATVQLLVLAIEAWSLRSQVLPQRYLATIPPIPAAGLSEAIHVQAPDLFALLTTAFWGPVWLWLCISIFLPCVAGYFVNLKGPPDQGGWCDYVSFNVAKALLVWIVFVQHGVEGESVEVLRRGVYGGHTGLLIGAGIGGLAGLYEAVLRN